MTKVIGKIIRPTAMQSRMVSLLEVDIDTLAERLIVSNRNTGKLLWHAIKPQSGLFKLIQPVGYSTSSDVMVVMLDDDRTYNAVIADGVKLQLVDANTVNMSQ